MSVQRPWVCRFLLYASPLFGLGPSVTVGLFYMCLYSDRGTCVFCLASPLFSLGIRVRVCCLRTTHGAVGRSQVRMLWTSSYSKPLRTGTHVRAHGMHGQNTNTGCAPSVCLGSPLAHTLAQISCERIQALALTYTHTHTHTHVTHTGMHGRTTPQAARHLPGPTHGDELRRQQPSHSQRCVWVRRCLRGRAGHMRKRQLGLEHTLPERLRPAHRSGTHAHVCGTCERLLCGCVGAACTHARRTDSTPQRSSSLALSGATSSRCPHHSTAYTLARA